MATEVIFYSAITSATVMVVSGFWALVETFFVFRVHLTRSLNCTLDVIKVVKPHNPEVTGHTAENRSQFEKEEIAIMEHLLTTLSDLQNKKSFFHRLLYGNPQLSFEMSVTSEGEQISFYIAIPSKFQELIEKQIHSFFPSAHIEKIKDYTIFRPESHTAGSFLKLKKDFRFPIRTYQRLESDPLHNLANALSKLEDPQEGASIQVVFRKSKSASNKIRTEKIAQEMQQGKRLDKVVGSDFANLAKGVGKGITEVLKKQDDLGSQSKKEDQPISLTPEENDIIKQIENKANKAHFEVNIRLLASAASQERAEMILAQLENAFVQFEDTNLNKFKALRDTSRNAHKLAFDYIFRNFRNNQRMVLDTEELASIYHFPISTTEAPKINWLRSKSAPPPTNIPKEGVKLGFSDFRGTKTEIKLARDDRRRHLYIVGQTGTGKSALIEEMAKQDAANGEGMCVIDPHGDLIDRILGCIPKERAEDVIYFDPSDTERPFGLNMLEYDKSKPEQKTFVINEMIAIFDKLYDLKQTGGPMFEQYMRNAMLLILDSPETGSTLMEVPRVLRDVAFRKNKLRACKDMTVVDFWEKEAEKAGGEAALENIAPYITSKLTTFISNDMMRPIISQQQSTLDFRKIMDEKKILLINLSKGKIGEINSHLLGMVIVGKLLMHALSRVDMAEDQRNDFYLYIDEFQNFTTDSIAQILAEARKYRLNLTIAHQFIGQLSETISKAVFGNVGSMCSFRVGAEDAEVLQKQFAPVFDANDLINLDNYNCYTKLLINNESTTAFDMKTFPPDKGSEELKDAFKEYCRYKYGRNREIVEEEIKNRYQAAAQVLEEEKEDLGTL